jgi:uncharacterized MAPEG superfamily protein
MQAQSGLRNKENAMTFTTALLAYGLMTLALIGFEIMFTYATKGFAYGFSSNRQAVDVTGFAMRVKRTLQNHIEAGAYGIPVLAVGAVMAVEGAGVELAALLFVLGRGAFVLLYYTGIPFVRVPAFAMGTLSILYIAITLLEQA